MSAVFILDKSQVKASFSAAAASYDSMAELQRRVGCTLLAEQDVIAGNGAILELGCGTGFLTERLLRLAEKHLVVALDIAFPMLQLTGEKLQSKGQLQRICADAEMLPFKKASFDQVYANLVFQWCLNMRQVFSDIKRTLSVEGKLIFSTFGPETLKELKQAWATVDNFTHVNEFYSAEQLCDFMRDAGFVDITFQTRRYICTYSDVWSLMKELKAIGAHNVSQGRNKQLTGKNQLQKMIIAYNLLQNVDYIPATFEVIYFQAQSSH